MPRVQRLGRIRPVGILRLDTPISRTRKGRNPFRVHRRHLSYFEERLLEEQQRMVLVQDLCAILLLHSEPRHIS